MARAIIAVELRAKGTRSRATPLAKGGHAYSSSAFIWRQLARAIEDRVFTGGGNRFIARVSSQRIGLLGKVQRDFCYFRNLQGACYRHSWRHGDCR